MPRWARVARNLGAVGASVALAAGLSACAASGEGEASDTAVAIQGAVDGPDQDGVDGADGDSQGGEGGDGGDAIAPPAIDDVVVKAPAQLRACMTRNRDVVRWAPELMRSTGWDAQGRQAAHGMIVLAVRQRLGVYSRFDGNGGPKRELVMSGLLGYALDPVGNRLIMQVDPSIVDLPKFQIWVTGVAREANRSVGVRGPQLTVTVQKGCFSARNIVAAREYANANAVRLQLSWLHSWVELDGRIRMAFVDRATADGVQRRLGPVAAVEQRPIGGI